MVALWWYTFLSVNVGPILMKKVKDLPAGNELKYRQSRLVEAWKFGSGLDYDDH